jgi:hypothetical protein
VELDHEVGRGGVGHRHQGREDRPDARIEERGRRTDQLVANRAADSGVAGPEHYGLGRDVDPFEIVNGEWTVSELKRREERAVRTKGSMGGQVHELGSAQAVQYRGHGCFLSPQLVGIRIEGGQPVDLFIGSGESRPGHEEGVLSRPHDPRVVVVLCPHQRAGGKSEIAPREAGEPPPWQSAEGGRGYDDHAGLTGNQPQGRDQQLTETIGRRREQLLRRAVAGLKAKGSTKGEQEMRELLLDRGQRPELAKPGPTAGKCDGVEPTVQIDELDQGAIFEASS